MTKTQNPVLAAAARGQRLNRREFIQTALAAGLTVAAAEAMFATVARAEGKRGGVFRLGLGGASTTDTLDPATYISTTTQIAYAAGVHNQLVEFMPDGTVKPELAESFEASPDAKAWTFKLRARRRVPQRQDAVRRRCHRLDQPSSRRGVEIGNEAAACADQGHQGGRAADRGRYARGAAMPTSLPDERLSHADHAREGRQGRLAVRHRRRGLQRCRRTIRACGSS